MEFYDPTVSNFGPAKKETVLHFIKAIETCWHGFKFRSRSEARWAVLLEALDITFEYEKEGFQLTPDIHYLPDFWIPYSKGVYCKYPNSGYWFEIKGHEPCQEDLTKLLLLSIFTKHSGRMAVGSPWNFKVYFTHHSGQCGWWPGEYVPIYPWVSPDDWPIFSLFWRFFDEENIHIIQPATLKTKRARFEYSEKA